MKRLWEVFEAEDGILSMSRLLMFGSFLVTSAIMYYITREGDMNEGYFSMYIGAWSGTYLIGKGIDSKTPKVET